MRGQIGVFYFDNNQVGGCLDWEITFKLNDYIDCKKRITDWKATAITYWFKERVRKVMAYFFWVINGKLVLAYKGELYIETIYEIGKKQTGLLEMVKEK